MIRSTRGTVVARIASAALLAGALLGIVPSQAQADSWERTFVWNRDLHAGDCTMFAGAKWTLQRDGWAHFTGWVTSGDDNDAWLMHAELFTRSEGYKGNIVAQQPGVDDITRFVINLPDSDQRYWWDVWGTYNAAWFDDLDRINLRSHC
ncbi:DUF6294 family protein [Nocardia amamiensis]|uniref:DUF6294 family protein n=1 Tax=Nocardia amamiensis TaxID=404578 RepID=UPI000A684060|nr:DUF6294 family protein [Nocardia amamiensis]